MGRENCKVWFQLVNLSIEVVYCVITGNCVGWLLVTVSIMLIPADIQPLDVGDLVMKAGNNLFLCLSR